MLGIGGGLYFLFAVATVAAIVRWCMDNESANPAEPTRGLFAMLDRKKKKVQQRWSPKRPG